MVTEKSKLRLSGKFGRKKIYLPIRRKVLEVFDAISSCIGPCLFAFKKQMTVRAIISKASTIVTQIMSGSNTFSELLVDLSCDKAVIK